MVFVSKKDFPTFPEKIKSYAAMPFLNYLFINAPITPDKTFVSSG